MKTCIAALSVVVLGCSTTDSVAVMEPAAPPSQYASVPRFQEGSAVDAPKAVHRVEPKPPADLIGGGPRRMRATVEALITADGRVEDIWYSSGDRAWAEIAMNAIREWRFQPARENGQPVAMRYLIETSFSTTGGFRRPRG
jgi:TonB family protein